MIFIPEYVMDIMNMLSRAGKNAYVVGGCVRDSLIGRNTADFDITTDATPDEVIEILSDIKVVSTGIRHGSVSAVTKGGNVEITTHRTESTYSDNRHPDGVCFTKDINKDLLRRDFTMNAIAYNPQKGLIDIFGGAQDIQKQTIRCVGNPRKRFEEDALRILRAVRFGATLGFSLDKETADAATDMCPLLSGISRERVFDELRKLVCGAFADEIIEKYKIIVLSALGIKDVERDFGKLRNAPGDADIRFALLLENFHEATQIISSLKCSRAFSESVSSLLRDKDFSPEGVEDVITFILKNGIGHAEKLSHFKGNCTFSDLLEKAKRESPCLTFKDLDINGGDIIKNTSLRGELVGKALDNLFLLVAKGSLANKKNLLLDYLKSKT